MFALVMPSAAHALASVDDFGDVCLWETWGAFLPKMFPVLGPTFTYIVIHITYLSLLFSLYNAYIYIDIISSFKVF